ncbi:MAG: hypothetical protein U0929_02105 [Planctomycetaceae bacterium]
MHALRSSFLVAILICGSLCADEATPVNSSSASVCAILIGGIDSDPSPEQINGTAPRGRGQSGMYQLAGDLNRQGITAEYFNWNGTRAGQIHGKAPLAAGIAEFICDRHGQDPAERIAIVANSWGGHTAWEVCRAVEEPAIPIDLVVFLDPSSLGRAAAKRPQQLPETVKVARNYYTRNVFGWRELPGVERLTNVDLGDAAHGFQIPGGPKYNAAFDVHAHIAAEWDPRIHDEITRHVVQLLSTSPITVAGGDTAVAK